MDICNLEFRLKSLNSINHCSGYVAVETSADKVNLKWSSLQIDLKLGEHIEIVSDLYSNCLINGILQKIGLV